LIIKGLKNVKILNINGLQYVSRGTLLVLSFFVN